MCDAIFGRVVLLILGGLCVVIGALGEWVFVGFVGSLLCFWGGEVAGVRWLRGYCDPCSWCGGAFGWRSVFRFFGFCRVIYMVLLCCWVGWMRVVCLHCAVWAGVRFA